MKIIKKIETITKWQVECPHCKSILEGDPDTEFECKTSISNSYYEFFCPVCDETRQICFYGIDDELKKFKRMVYKYDPKTGEIGELIREG